MGFVPYITCLQGLFPMQTGNDLGFFLCGFYPESIVASRIAAPPAPQSGVWPRGQMYTEQIISHS